MRVTDLPNLSNTAYGRAEALKRELTALVNYAESNPSSAEAMATWFTAAGATVDAKLLLATPE